jgi:hypothetical protein
VARPATSAALIRSTNFWATCKGVTMDGPLLIPRPGLRHARPDFRSGPVPFGSRPVPVGGSTTLVGKKFARARTWAVRPVEWSAQLRPKSGDQKTDVVGPPFRFEPQAPGRPARPAFVTAGTAASRPRARASCSAPTPRSRSSRARERMCGVKNGANYAVHRRRASFIGSRAGI